MDKKEILDILDNAKDERGAVPMRLVRQAFDKLVQPEERTEERTETHACDLISRQAAIDLLSDYANTVSLDEKLNVSARIAIQIGITNCIGIVNHNIPSVQPERKKGKWKFEKMKHIINGEVRDAIICSECDSGYFRYDISDNTVQNIPNFCPNCGADMRGGQDE